MKNKKYLLLIPVVALGLTACQDPTTTTTTTSDPGSTTTTSEPDPTTTTTEPPAPVISVASVLTKLQESNVAISGVYDYSVTTLIDGEEYPQVYSTIDCYVSNERYYNVETDITTEAVLWSVDYFANPETGNVEARYLDPTTNEATSSELYDQTTGETVLFASLYYNPFLMIEESSGQLVNDTVSFALDELAGGELWGILTGYDGIAEYLDVKVDLETGNLISASLGMEPVVQEGQFEGDETVYEMRIEKTFDFDFVSESELNMPSIEPRTKTSDHTALEEAFETLQAGNYTVDYVAVETEDPTYVTEYHIVVTQSGIEIDESYGVIATDEGSVEYEINASNEVVASSTPDAEVDVLDYAAPFSILPEMFDLVGENTYVYAVSGTEDLLPLTMPEFAAGLINTPYEGTFTITLNSDNTITMSYIYGVEFFGMILYEEEVEVTISNIGSTVFPHNPDDLVPFTPADSWEDIPEAVEFLNELGLPVEDFPWWLPEGADTWEVSYSYFYTTTTATEDEFLQQAQEVYEAAGWVYTGLNDYGEYEFTYQLDALTIIPIGLLYDGGDVELWLYDPQIIYEDTAIDTWLETNFANQEEQNYTLSVTLTESITQAQLDSEGYASLVEGAEPVTTVYETTLQADGDVVRIVSGNGYEEYYTNDAEGGVSYWTLADGAWSSQKATDSYGDQLDSWQQDVLFTPFDLIGTEGFSATDDPNVVDIKDTYDSYAMDYIIGLGNISIEAAVGDSDLASGTATLDPETNTLTFDITIEGGYYYLDEEQTTVGYIEQTLEIIVSNVGTTEVTVPFTLA